MCECERVFVCGLFVFGGVISRMLRVIIIEARESERSCVSFNLSFIYLYSILQAISFFIILNTIFLSNCALSLFFVLLVRISSIIFSIFLALLHL